MPFYDFLIYKEPQPKHSPRRINTDEYQIEWHRKGIFFKKCPQGLLCQQDNNSNCFEISSDTIILWNQLVDKARYDVMTLTGEKQYTIRMFNRNGVDTLLHGFNEIYDDNVNANKEILWFIAEFFEDNWIQNASSKEAKETLNKLIDLPKSVDDALCKQLIATWQQRLKEHLIKDLQSDDERIVIEAIADLKKIVTQDIESE